MEGRGRGGAGLCISYSKDIRSMGGECNISRGISDEIHTYFVLTEF